MKTEDLKIAVRKKAVNLIKIVVSVCVIWFIGYYVGSENIIEKFQAADYFYVIPAFLLVFVKLYLQYSKWILITKSLLFVDDKRTIINSLFFGISAALITPLMLGEYLGRAVPFKNKKILNVSFAVFIDKMIPLIILIIFGSCSMIFFLYYYQSFELQQLLPPVFVVGFVIFILYKTHLLKRFWNAIKALDFVSKRLKFKREVEQLNWPLLKKHSAISFAQMIVLMLQFSLLIAAFNEGFHFEYIIMSILVMFSKSFVPPISIADLGFREGFAVYYFGMIGIEKAAAFNAAIGLFVLNVVLPAVIGLILIIRDKK